MESVRIEDLLCVLIGLSALQSGVLLGFVFCYGLKLR